jgi:hypothetical protein
MSTTTTDALNKNLLVTQIIYLFHCSHSRIWDESSTFSTLVIQGAGLDKPRSFSIIMVTVMSIPGGMIAICPKAAF